MNMDSKEIEFRILQVLYRHSRKTGGVMDASDESISKEPEFEGVSLTEIRFSLNYLEGAGLIEIQERAGEHLLFIGITSQGIDKTREIEKKSDERPHVITTSTPRPPYIGPGHGYSSLSDNNDISRNDDNDWLQDVVSIRLERSNRIRNHWNKHKYHLWLPVILFCISTLIVVVAIVVDDYHFTKIESNIPPNKSFPANITITTEQQPIIINLMLRGEPFTQVNTSLNGVVPDPGIITLRLSNYTLNPQYYNKSQIEISSLSLKKNEQIAVTPTQAIQKDILLVLIPVYIPSDNYGGKDPKIFNESYIGTITISADYYDQITNKTQSYPFTFPLKARMLGYPMGY